MIKQIAEPAARSVFSQSRFSAVRRDMVVKGEAGQEPMDQMMETEVGSS